MNKIFSNKSLRFIINALNAGLVEYEEIETIKIVSDKKPDFFIKVIDVDITDYVSSMIKKSKDLSNISFVETNFHDYIVFGKDKNEQGEITLVAMSLLELINISTKLITEDNQTKNENFVDKNIWSLDNEDWDLIDEKN